MRKSDWRLVPALRRHLLPVTLFSAGVALAFVRFGGEELPSPQGVIHPIPDGIVSGDVPVTFLSVDEEGADDRGALQSEDHSEFPAAFVPTEIGVLDGVDGEVFGRIRDLVTDDAGRIVILDSQRRRLSVFGPGGKLLHTLGREGDGPGELRHPRAITFTADGSLYVFEARGRVMVFARGGDTLRFARSYRIERTIADACVIGDRLFVHTASRGDGRVVQSYGPDGKLLNSFGEVYRDGTPLIQEQLSTGKLACLDDPPRIVLAPSALPIVRAFDLSGEPLWSVKLQGFSSIEAYRTARGSILQVPASGYHVNHTLTPSPDGGRLLLQVALVTRESRRDREPYERLRTLVLSGDGSRGSYLGEGLAPVYGWTRSAVLTVLEDPFPRVVAHRFDAAP